jgi:hypothetical protein
MQPIKMLNMRSMYEALTRMLSRDPVPIGPITKEDRNEYRPHECDMSTRMKKHRRRRKISNRIAAASRRRNRRAA